jgi:copper chaperone CopZ
MITQTKLAVAGMTCDACRTAVRDALELPGVRQVGVSLDTGLAEVTHTDSVSAAMLISAIEGTGYEAREARTE